MSKKEKKTGMPKAVLNLLVILAVIITICVEQIGVMAMGLFGMSKVNEAVASDSATSDTEETAEAVPEEYLTKWASEESDIEGMTILDKYQMGLATNIGSDTDGDGLTDQEEIEVYGSDPLKSSTAGDLYTDQYKVANDMDVNTYYEYDDLVAYPYNECTEVTLAAEIPEDFNAVVQKIDCDATVNGQEVYAEYRVYHYSGILTIDVSEIMTDTGLKASELLVLGSDGGDLGKYGCKAEGNSLVLRDNLAEDRIYNFYIIQKTAWTNFAITIGKTATLSIPTDTEDDDVTGAGLVLSIPLLSFINPKYTMVYYEDLGDDAKNDALKKKIIGPGQEFSTITSSSLAIDWDGVEYRCVNRFVIDIVYDLLNEYLSYFNYSSSEEKYRFCLFYYYSYEERMTYELLDDPEYTGEQNGFNLYEDALPFQNFVTATGTDGNCAGMTHLTTYVFNNGSYPAFGSYTYTDSNGQEQCLEWELSTDPENATLMDRGLYDYKTADLVDEYGSFTRSLSEGEQQFANMISAVDLEGNYWFNYYYYYIYGGPNSTVEYDYALITATENRLENEVLDLQLKMNDGTGHALVIYDYEEDETDPDVVWFKVYDPNYPITMLNAGTSQLSNGARLSETGFKIKVTKVHKQVGEGYTFTYEYAPFSNSSYGASSTLQKAPFIMIMDENWHLLND